MSEVIQQTTLNGDAGSLPSDGSGLAIVADVVKDLLQQQIPGSVVILILAVVFVPMGFRSWFKHRRK